MSLIVFKLTLPPLLILAASLAGRRWGDAIGGWLVGLPLTSGPVAAFLAVQYGPDFAAAATNGSLVGTAAQACFSLGYVLIAQRGWLAALVCGTAAYALAGLLLQSLPLAHWGFFLVALAALIGAARFIPHRAAIRVTVPTPWWDLPARMLIATLIVLTLTAAAAFVGPKTAGVLASFPVFGTILAIFAHRISGATMAIQVLRGMVLALYGFATFFFVLGLLLTTAGVLPAFLAALACTLLVQTGALRLLRRGHSLKAA
ncbi:hypothetical protein [Bradyrhizobium betae]|uniref:Uncharacterized protein n=1 Tax=Bradyrhizobium betae TaxID=244734 RepID=A0A5P6PC44_9BRAD|nr:hypothetical protein [Bradyrhizobium betae]MCS3731627.1 hypothetical protein [Bradyrhizobium betae]QFI75668.1 hypothetical protein F8237_26680 [Bradyrhizobium betae]